MIEVSQDKIYKTKEGRNFIFKQKANTEDGCLDLPWSYCFQAMDTGGEIWCTRAGIEFLFTSTEELIGNGTK